MALTNNLTLIHACNALTDATTSHVLSGTGSPLVKTYAVDEVTPREGTGCYGVDLDIETLYFNIAHASTSWNFTNSTIFGWFSFVTSPFLDTWQNGGVTCRLYDASSNYSEWYLGGSDTLDSNWRRLCFSTSTTPDAVSGTVSISAITNIRFYFTGIQKSKLGENVLMDFLHYGADGVGMTMTGGSSGTPETWADVYGDDNTAALGLVFRQDGVYFLNGSIIFGDSGGTSDMYFDDSNRVISTIGRYRSFTTTNRTSAETLLSSSHYGITVEGNTTGTHSFVMGDATGTSGYNGCTILAGGEVQPTLTIGNANVDIFDLYGCGFTGFSNTTLVNDSSHHLYSCNFSDSGQVIPTGAPVIRNCNFINTSDVDASLLWNASIDIENCKFIANTTGAAIEHPSTGSFTYTGLTFYGNTYDVLNSSGSGISISVSGADTAASYEGSAVTFLSSVDIDVHVENEGGIDVANAQVYIQKSASGKQWNYTSHASNNTTGDTTFEVVEVVDTDLPQAGWLHAWDASTNTKQNYRYASWTGKIFTLNTTLSNNCTGGGTSTLLQDSVNDFTAIDINEGDTVRNTTTGAWAVVDEITDASNITTTPLSSGVWTSGNTYSFHTLAVDYATADKIDIPLLNDQTDTNGDVSGSYNWGAIGVILPVRVRIRLNQGSSKYIPYDTSGSITGTGYSLTAVVTEDEVAT